MPKQAKPVSRQELVEGEIMSLANMELQYSQTKSELAATDDRLRAFFELERKIKETSKEIEAHIIEGMVAIKKKTLEGSYGKITLVEKPGFDIDKEKLPAEYWKLQPDVAKIGSAYALMGEPPEGATPKISRYLRKTFKKGTE